MLNCKEIREHPKLRNQNDLLGDDYHKGAKKNGEGSGGFKGIGNTQNSTAKLHFTPRKKYTARVKPAVEVSDEEEESKLPLTRLQKIEKLIEGELPKRVPNVAAENAKVMLDRQSLLGRMRPAELADKIYKPVLEE